MTNQQIAVLRQIGRAILEAVQAGGEMGAPGGTLYAVGLGQECTWSQFEQIMDGMVRANVLTKDGDCYHVGTAAHNIESLIRANGFLSKHLAQFATIANELATEKFKEVAARKASQDSLLVRARERSAAIRK